MDPEGGAEVGRWLRISLWMWGLYTLALVAGVGPILSRLVSVGGEGGALAFGLVGLPLLLGGAAGFVVLALHAAVAWWMSPRPAQPPSGR